MSENENKEIEQELSMLDEQKIAEEAEKVIAEKTEEPDELPELVFAEDLFETDENDIPDNGEAEEVTDAEDDLFFGVNAALAEQIENEFGGALAPTEEKKPNKVAAFLKEVPTWTKVLVIVILLILLSVGFFFGTKPGRSIVAKIVVEILLGDIPEDPNETPTPTQDVSPTMGAVTTKPTTAPTGGASENPTGVPTQTITPLPTKTPVMDSEDVINILLLGEENIFGATNGRTDAILLASLNKRTGEIGLVSFLRDTYVRIPGKADNRLNAAFSAGGAPLVVETIELNFQVDIDGYVVVNFKGFEDVIDALGGLDISLTAKESEYLNTTRYISNPEERNTVAGMQTMTGSQVLGYCRVRHVPTANGLRDDYGRNYRHRVVIQALFDKYKEKGMGEIGTTINMCYDYVRVSSNFKSLAAECLEAVMANRRLSMETLQMPAKGYRSEVLIGGQEMITFFPENVDILQEFLFGETAN